MKTTIEIQNDILTIQMEGMHCRPDYRPLRQCRTVRVGRDLWWKLRRTIDHDDDGQSCKWLEQQFKLCS